MSDVRYVITVGTAKVRLGNVVEPMNHQVIPSAVLAARGLLKGFREVTINLYTYPCLPLVTLTDDGRAVYHVHDVEKYANSLTAGMKESAQGYREGSAMHDSLLQAVEEMHYITMSELTMLRAVIEGN